MKTLEADVTILGSGFGGTLLALVLQKLGRTPLLLERHAHPRFAIGESSTPLANLFLENLCRTYDLEQLLPFCKYGSWKRTHPEVTCGLKRGFSFFKHAPGERFEATDTHSNELLVAANPSAELGDTQWFREEVDFYFVQEAQRSGIPYLDQTEVTEVDRTSAGRWQLRARRPDTEIRVTTPFLVDATGASAFLYRLPAFDARTRPLRTRSWTLFSHFKDVRPWAEVLDELGARQSDYPFDCDDAALHHVFDHGWMWLIRFDNDVTSAGLVFNRDRRPFDPDEPKERIWQEALAAFPSLQAQFRDAEPVRDYTVLAPLQRRQATLAGDGWAALPFSACFIDPLFSTGIAHTLLGVERLARLFEHGDRLPAPTALHAYSEAFQGEIDFLDRLVHGAYRAFPCFELFVAYAMYYFTGAIYSEMRRKRNLWTPDDAFLFSHDPRFRQAAETAYHVLLELDGAPTPAEVAAFTERVARDIAPLNVAGLADPSRHNLYPFVE